VAAARNGAVLKWALGVLATLVTASVAWAASTSIAHGEQIVRLETKQEAIERSIEDLKDGQQDILDKLDEIARDR
jgi:cell division protein FtsB